MEIDDDIPPIALLFLVGMMIPFVVGAAFEDLLSLYLSGRQFIYIVGSLFFLLAWVFLAVAEPDHLNFRFASIVFPWMIIAGVLYVGIMVEGLAALEYVVHDVEDLGAYAISFMIPGLAANSVHRRLADSSREFGGISVYRLVPIAVSLFVVIGAITGIGFLHVTATSTSITTVETDVVDYRSSGFVVTIDGEPTELRLSISTPKNSTYTKRLSPAELDDESTSITVPFHLIRGDVQAGTYTIEIQSITGEPVDTAHYTIETAPTPRILHVDTADSGAALDLDLPPDAGEVRPSPGLTDDSVRIGVVIRNEGDVADSFHTRLRFDGERIGSMGVFLEPGRQAGLVIDVSAEAADKLRATPNARVTVEVVSGEQTDRTVIEISEL